MELKSINLKPKQISRFQHASGHQLIKHLTRRDDRRRQQCRGLLILLNFNDLSQHFYDLFTEVCCGWCWCLAVDENWKLETVYT